MSAASREAARRHLERCFTPEQLAERARRREEYAEQYRAGPWYEDPLRRWPHWLPSDVPLARYDQPAPSRNDIRDAAREACLARGVAPGLAERIAADAATCIAQRYVRWRQKGVQAETETPENAITGRARRRALSSLAGTLRRRDLDAEEITACLMVLNESRCDPPLPDSDLVAIAKSMAEKEAARPLAMAA